MRLHPLTVTAVLAVVLATLAVSTLSYRSAQQSLLREANRLYSGRALAVEGDLGRAIDRARQGDLDVQVYRLLTGDGMVRAVLSTTGDLPEIPTHDVAWRVTDERTGALVGADIARAGTTVKAGDRTYRVAGLLGAQDRSLVSGDVLIYDPAQFVDVGSEKFVIDGPGAATLAATVGHPHPAAGDFNRRTTVDFVSPIIIALSSAALVVGAGVSGYLVFSRGRRHGDAQRLWGRSRAGVLLRGLGSSCAIWVSVFALASAALGLSAAPASSVFQLFQAGALTLVVFAGAFIVSTLARKRAV